jgi:hypothetical protein
MFRGFEGHPGIAVGARLRDARRCVQIPTVVRIHMPQTVAKLSVSIPMDLATAVRRRVGARGLSGFVARAMVHELEREQLQAFMGELDAIHGSVSAGELSKARRVWPKR